jgi:hypothetical protein
MPASFLESYRDVFGSIEGWFSPDAALMFMAYHELVAAHGVSGDVLEIGVHHGLSTIAIAAMRREGAGLVAVDLFDQLQDQNISASGHGSRAHFERNMAAFYGETGFIRCIAGASSTLTPADLGDTFSFCHVDGGHTALETYQDLDLCTRILMAGGLLALDDYFNPAFPGVCEGAIKFWLAREAQLIPIAIGFNKVLFQKTPAPFDLNEAFDRRLQHIPHKTTTFWETPVHSFGSFAPFIDLQSSSPTRLVPNRAFQMDALVTPEASEIMASLRGGTIHVPVRVLNRSSIPFNGDMTDAPFALSYHLLTEDGRDLQFDNVRSYFRQQVAPDEERTVDLAVEVPHAPGHYNVEVDIVWEGITWLKTRGLATPRIALTVV